MTRSARVYRESCEENDLEKQLSPVAEEPTDKPNFDKQKPSIWLSLDSDEQYNKYYDFLIEQSSKTSVLLCVATLQILFGYYFILLLISGATSRPGGYLVLVGGTIRVLSSGFGWLHLYFLNSDAAKSDISKRRAIMCADQYIFWSCVAGCFIIVYRTVQGACGENDPETICNPRHEERGVPLDSLGGSLLIIIILPLIFKAHQTKYLCLSYVIALTGMVTAAIIAKASSDTVLIFGLCFAFGTLVYDNKRNMMTMFIVLQGQWSYYDRMLKIERNKANAEMESVELRKLIGSVAHDLKTPLQAIMVELDGLQSEVNGVRQHTVGLANMNSPAVSKHSNEITTHTDEVQKYIESLKDVYQFMMMTINRAIEYRKMASGIQLMSTKETFHLGSAVDWVVARFSNNPAGVPIRVENNLGDKYCPYLITDKHWFTENLLTLLSNACKFTTKGEIVVRFEVVIGEVLQNSFLSKCESSVSHSSKTFKDDTCCDDLRERMFFERTENSSDGKQYLRIEVEDSGIGVGASEVKHLFKPFSKMQRRVGGTGLGLHSLHARVKDLDGRCGFRHRQGGLAGCCFWFVIPYIPDSVTWEEYSRSKMQFNVHECGWTVEDKPCRKEYIKAHVPCAEDDQENNTQFLSESLPNSNEKVLVVDDSMLVLKTTSRMLGKEGFEVETAQNGEDALNMMMNNEYLFILSDIQMPVMDGLEMTKRIREVEKSNATLSSRHIIGMSANSDTQTRDESLNCGMNDFVPKPVRISTLTKLIPTLSATEELENVDN